MPNDGKRAIRVVVIEDNTPDVILIGECLNGTSTPYELIHFRDGDEALAGVKSTVAGGRLPDLIVLDLNMPKVNGLEVLEAIKQDPVLANVPVVVLTSSAAPEERQAAERLGADRYLRKPFDLYEFLEQVGGIVRELIPLDDTRP
ncbi:MAG: response regulator [Acidobacteriaceae bacterium]|nr:response regulator [Acidobacteriaceae bacterium]MBV8572140.1 response regulator [Acidobacteriaceae bacterium]